MTHSITDTTPVSAASLRGPEDVTETLPPSPLAHGSSCDHTPFTRMAASYQLSIVLDPAAGAF